MPAIQIRDVLAQVSPARLRADLDALAGGVVPFRKANYTIPGHCRSTLDEADDYLLATLAPLGCTVTREPCRVQAFRCCMSRPPSQWYAAPHADDPWYTVDNLSAEWRGGSHPDELILACAHKDSQSWIDSPGGYDNAVGTVALLELARLLDTVDLHRTVRLLWCNEEHRPWTSETAAAGCRERGDRLLAVLNVDGIGGRPPDEVAASRRTFVAGWTEPPGDALAQLTAEVNANYDLGLDCSQVRREFANDDDGSFVKAGFPQSIICIGSFPYRHAAYHRPEDAAAAVDHEVVAGATQVVLGTLLRLDRDGFHP